MIYTLCCGEGGIRTLDTLVRCTHFPGALLKPLGHLSIIYPRVSTLREIGRKIRIIFGFRPPCKVFIFSEFQNRHFTTTNPPSWRKSCNSRGLQVSLNTTNNYERRKMRYQAFGLRHQRRKQRRQLLHHQTPRREKARLRLWYQKVAKKAGYLCRPSFLRKVNATALSATSRGKTVWTDPSVGCDISPAIQAPSNLEGECRGTKNGG